jgi:hypothetical protein
MAINKSPVKVISLNQSFVMRLQLIAKNGVGN